MAHATSLYKVDDATGALTAIKTGLSSSATNYRFVVVNDIVYYINGFDGLRKWDFTTESQVNSTNYTHIAVHKGLLFLCEKNDPNKVVFSNFADYETYTSTDFVYVPAPKTGDPVSAIYSLNGNLVLHTRFNKYILYGSDNATFLLEQAPGKKGTYTQETVAVDKNFAYFLSDDGLYAFNGTTDELLSESFYETIRDLPNKETSCLIIFKGRVRLFYAESGLAYNNACIVFNTTFDALESFDTGTYVARATVAFLDDRLIVGSSRVGQAYYQELDSNDYTNCGDVLQFDLQTHYMTFGSSAKFKEIRYWKPRFEAQSGDYEITCSYATDLRENSQTQSTPNTQGEGSVWGSSGTVWGSFTWGTTSELQGDLHVPGEYRRVQFRYSHTAARQPHKFLGHTFVVETRKLR